MPSPAEYREQATFDQRQSIEHERDELRAALGAAQKEWHHWQRAYMNLAPRFEQSCADLERLRALIDKHNDECRECPVIET